MLMSEDLDPSIGNINRQPENAIAEIGKWIQHTWEYSHPIKYEYLKQVIARGVTLRRVELWKQIKNGEDKPDTMSDRTWHTLERQLDNPASIRKSENCRRANASRVNFGRIGPSGEVGVRHRLRRMLRRSPDPEEVRYEMSRNKGSVRRKPLSDNDLNIMHGSGIPRRIHGGNRRITEEKILAMKTKNDEEHEEDTAEYAIDKLKFESNANAREEEEAVGETLLAMSAEKISEHPFVKMMMKRLEALEGKNREKEVEDHLELQVEVPHSREVAEGVDPQQSVIDHKDVGKYAEGEKEAMPRMRTSGRLRKQGKQT